MKKIFLLTILLFSNSALSQSFPIPNPYAPKYEDVVVLYDVSENDFSPFLYHQIMGEYLDMARHDSCKTIKILPANKRKAVVCVSSENQEVVVGELSESFKQEGFDRIYHVFWNTERAELVQFVNARNGDLEYSIVVK